MITEPEFKAINQEVVDAVNETYDKIKALNNDYIILIADGDYKPKYIKSTPPLNPYTIDDKEDIMFDRTRLNFMVEFLNAFYSFQSSSGVEDSEIRLNMELMVYSHIWEATPILKRLYRLVKMAQGFYYPWKVDVPPMGKHNFILAFKTELLSTKMLLGNILDKSFHSTLRNAFAHSEYSINMDEKYIWLSNYSGKAWDIQQISFDNWSKRFAYTVLLNYRLDEIHSERRKLITTDLNTQTFTIRHPSAKHGVRSTEIEFRPNRQMFNFKYPKPQS